MSSLPLPTFPGALVIAAQLGLLDEPRPPRCVTGEILFRGGLIKIDAADTLEAAGQIAAAVNDGEEAA